MADAALSFLLILVFIAVLAFFAYSFMGPADGAHQTQPPDTTVPVDHDVESGATHYDNPQLLQGLDPTVVRALPVVKCAPGGTKGPCVVCLGEFEEEERVKVIPGCGHVFHPSCIDEWLLLHGSCPICRCSQFLGAGAGAVELRRRSVDGGAHDVEEGGRKLEGLGRSRIFGWAGEGESSTSLSRTCRF